MDDIHIFETTKGASERPGDGNLTADIAEQLAEALTGWTAHANRLLPEAAQLNLQLDRPEWIDARKPAHAIHELYRIGGQLPQHLPSPSVSVNWTEGELNAYRVLTGIRACSDSLKAVSAPPNELVSIAKSFLDLGVLVTRAHVQPWERFATLEMRKQLALARANKGTPAGSANAQRRLKTAEQRALWQREAEQLWQKNSRLSKSAISRLLVERFGLEPKQGQWIRKNITRHK